MKLVQLITFLVALSAISLAQTKSFNRTVDFTPGGDLRVNTDVGTVKITSWDRNQVEVIARIEGRNNESVSADYMRRAVEATEIEMIGSGNNLTVKANYENVPYESKWGGKNRVIPRIEWEIRAPRRANIDLDTDRSEADVRGFEGRHSLKTDRTPLRVEDMAGDIRLDIDRGKLEMRMAGSQGLNVSMNKERRSSFQSDFPITTNGFSDDKIEGAINGGGPRLTLHTDRTQVYLKNN